MAAGAYGAVVKSIAGLAMRRTHRAAALALVAGV